MIKRKKVPRKALWEKSYAKINLYLEVFGRRPDGYHQIKTILTEIELHDEMNFAPAESIDVKLVSDSLPDNSVGELTPQNNIVYKAAEMMRNLFSVKQGVRVAIKKNIPLSAGLGGGSSNAALTINRLSELWGLDLSYEQKKRISTCLGSDISFFLRGGTALAEGRGEKITKLNDITLQNILLIKPKFGISSKTAYHLYSSCNDDDDQSFTNWPSILLNMKTNQLVKGKISEGPEAPDDPSPKSSGCSAFLRSQAELGNEERGASRRSAPGRVKEKFYPTKIPHFSQGKGNFQDKAIPLFNRLESKIRKHYPEIDEIINFTSSNGAAQSMLSGSGSTVIALYEKDEILNEHFTLYQKKGYWVYKTKTRT